MSAPTAAYRTLDRPAWLPPAQWPFALHALDVDGCRVHVLDEGQGPTLLLVHAGTWAFVWRDLVRELLPGHRCVALDFPGSGLTGATADRPMTLTAHADLLGRVVDTLGLRDIVLVGHDLGGPVGLRAMATRADRVRGVAMINTFGWPPRAAALRAMLGLVGSRPVTATDVATGWLWRLTSGRFGVGRRLDRSGRAAFRGPVTADPGRRATIHRLMADATRSADLFTDVEAALTGPLADRPALTLFGQFNDPFGFQDRWRRLFPAGRHVVLRHGNHFPMCDDPALVAGELAAFVAGLPAGPPVSRDRRP